MLLFETALVPVHVETNPPVTQAAELEVMAILNKANGIVDQLKETSPEVVRLMSELQEVINDYERDVCRNKLRAQYEAALHQEGISPELACAFYDTIR